MAERTASDQKLIATAKSRYKLAMDALNDSRESELDDLRFLAGSPDNMFQWPANVQQQRASNGSTINARPCLTINKLPQHVLQVTNDQRQNRPAGKVIPVDDKADVEMAEIFDGMVRHIEYISDADVAYDTACSNQVGYGEGYFRIYTEYCDENSFEQDIKIGRIRNSFSVYMDPTIQDPCGSDAEWCLVTEDLLRDEFERQYPDATPISQWMDEGVGDQGMAAWVTDKTIRIAEYFYVENVTKTLHLYQVPEQGDISVLEGSAQDVIAKARGLAPLKSRKTVIRQVKRCKINGYEVLERNDWAGKWIPIIRVVGNEFEIEGNLYISGLVRNAKDAQRMYNYWTSQEAEMLALAPKAPFIGYGGQFEGYEEHWKTANTTNWPYLEVNPEVTDHDGRVLPLPKRAEPPMVQNGLLQAKLGAADDIKGTTGQYDPSLGDKSNETSGRAIIAREKQSDTGTYHYVDNLARAIRYGTRQVVDLIPKIYDTKRVARIIGLDGETDHAQIDPMQAEPVRKIKDEATGAVIQTIYNPGVGTYDVAVTTGPSYMTKRQETAATMSELAQGITDPTLRLLVTYFAVKNLDFPEVQEFSSAAKKLLPPGLLDSEEDDPELTQAKQVIEQQQQQLDQAMQMLQRVQTSFEAQDLKNKQFEADIKAYDAETKRFSAISAMGTPEELQMIVRKTIAEMMQEQPLEQEEIAPDGAMMQPIEAGQPIG